MYLQLTFTLIAPVCLFYNWLCMKLLNPKCPLLTMMIWQRVSSPLGAVSLPVSVLSQAGMAKYYRIRHFRYRWTGYLY